MSKIVQEKFEVREPYEGNDDARGGWKTDSSARAQKNIRNRVDRSRGISSSSGLENARFNRLPPGMNIEDQDNAAIRKVRINTAGQLGNPVARGNRTEDLNAKALREGFDRKKMRPTDDMYSNEHVDAFYGEAEVDGVTGFLERNNMLDRS